MKPLSFTHRYEPALTPGLPPLLLMHGTGGDENDLVSLGQRVAPGGRLEASGRTGHGQSNLLSQPVTSP